MRAAVYHGKHDVRVEDVAGPSPADLGPDDVLLRPLWCGICGTDLHEYAVGPIVIPTDPHPLTGARLPQILGHEFSAEVAATGAEVAHVVSGDRVAVMPLVFCGRCHHCVRGMNHLCTRMACTGLSWAWGGIAELAVVGGYQVAKLPEAVSDVQGALVEPAAVAAYGVDRGNVRPGDVVLVTGAGPIGGLAALYAHACGAEVLVSEPNRHRAALIQSLGIAEVLDPTQVDVAEAVRERTGGVGADVAVECAGNARALHACIEATRSHGTVVQTGLHVAPAQIDPATLSLKDLSVIRTWCYPVYDWPRIIRLIASGRYPVERVVTAQIAPEQIVSQGFEALVDP